MRGCCRVLRPTHSIPSFGGADGHPVTIDTDRAQPAQHRLTQQAGAQPAQCHRIDIAQGLPADVQLIDPDVHTIACPDAVFATWR